MRGAFDSYRIRITLRLRARARTLLVVAGAVGIMHAVLAAGATDVTQVGRAWQTALLIMAVVASLVVTSGIVSHDLSEGTVVLWLQKPVQPMWFYAGRFVEILVLASALTLVVAVVATAAASAWAPEAGHEVARLLPTALLVSGLGTSFVFGVSSWCRRHDGTIALVLLLAGLFVENEIAVRYGESAGLGPSLLRAVLVPGSALREVSAFFEVGQGRVWTPVLHVLTYAACWVLLGLYGTARVSREPFRRG